MSNQTGTELNTCSIFSTVAKYYHRLRVSPRPFTTEYEREKGQLRTVIPALLAAYPEVGREELMMGERRVLQAEKSAVLDAIRVGVVSDEVGERLLEETNLKLDRVEAGESTVMDGRKGYEVWRERVGVRARGRRARRRCRQSG
ncbi:hypothetical protein [Haloarchaeobius sp. DYHT-AS-18]|uniref:hypothetical protein n=1 Tax=Haloarchaeobius sp. DYHT-AS-18 TaxID=3446117 RepID=UPI003EBBEE1A